MPSTHLSLHYHIIFSTKNRERMLDDSWRARMHAFLGGAVKTLGGVPEKIGGTDDHVHLLIGLKATHCLSDVLRDVKSGSSDWAHAEMKKMLFGWQDGYGGFTVSPSKLEEVRNYIANQVEHHREKTFKEEYLDLLQKSGVKYNEEFIW